MKPFDFLTPQKKPALQCSHHPVSGWLRVLWWFSVQQDAETAVRAATAAANPALNDAARRAEATAAGFGNVQYDTSPEVMDSNSCPALHQSALQQPVMQAVGIRKWWRGSVS